VRESLIAWLLIATALVFVGVGLNRFVVSSNGGRMPVDTGFSASLADGRPIDERRVVTTSKTKVAFLGDCIPVLKGILPFGVISIGDVVMLLGGIAGLIPLRVLLGEMIADFRGEI
jgi:hypothetical protein